MIRLCVLRMFRRSPSRLKRSITFLALALALPSCSSCWTSQKEFERFAIQALSTDPVGACRTGCRSAGVQQAVCEQSQKEHCEFAKGATFVMKSISTPGYGDVAFMDFDVADSKGHGTCSISVTQQRGGKSAYRAPGLHIESAGCTPPANAPAP
jgi:hypothetical protein